METDGYLDALLSLPRMWGAAVSRDGMWVAWTWAGLGPTADVYVAPTDGVSRPVRLTDTDEDTYLVSWTPDSRALLVEQDVGGNERAQLFRVDVDHPFTMAALTEPDPDYFMSGGQLHPDGRRLVYGINYDVAAGREIEPTWVYRQDLATGERVVLARPEKGGSGAPHLNATGTHVLYTRSDLDPAGSQVWLVDVDGRDDREVLNFGDDVKAGASWLPDGRRALVTTETTTHKKVGIWDREDGSLRWIIDDPARNIEYAHVPFGGDHAVIGEVTDARTCASLYDLASGTEEALPRVAGTLSPIAPVGEGDWVGLAYSSTQPTDVVRFRPGELPHGEALSISRVWDRTSLTPGDFAAAREMRWTSDDGLGIRGWLYRPEGESTGAVVYIHGGPTGHSADAINTQIQFFVRSGFAVLDPNYRGSTGFSLAFREAIRECGWGGAEQDDIRSGIDALIEAGIAESGKVGVTGTSYGGYSSWCQITRFGPETVAAAAPICGMTDLVVDYETTRPDLRPYSEEMMGGSPADVPERYRERSPIHFVGAIRGRLLIVQGMRDPNVTPENVSAVRRALDEAGVDCEVLTFDDEGHGISKPRNQKTLYVRLLEFFAEAFGRSEARRT